MNIVFQQENGVTVALMSGRLDSVTSPTAERELSAGLERSAGFLIDLGELEYVSSAGLRVFLMLAKQARASAKALGLCSLRREVSDVFEISGFSTLFTLFPGRAAGIQAFASEESDQGE